MGNNVNFVTRGTIPGLIVIERPTVSDERGFFREVERRDADIDVALNIHVVHRQWNHSRSGKGVLRGIHSAKWTKCIYVVQGEAQAVIVDLRKDSDHFGQHEAFLVGDSRRATIVVPPECGNSFLVLSESIDYIYSVDREWYPGGEYGITWNDPDLAIDWKITGPLVLSEKDAKLPGIREVFPEKFRLKANNAGKI
jgi:dTDP-4-dehydrorhamnose 3,5-epimerase